MRTYRKHKRGRELSAGRLLTSCTDRPQIEAPADIGWFVKAPHGACARIRDRPRIKAPAEIGWIVKAPHGVCAHIRDRPRI